jgi:hypothetical protein
MEFFALSLPEAAYFYTGLAAQSLTRNAFSVLPRVLVALHLVRLFGRMPGRWERGHLWHIVVYMLISIGLMILFWPETVIFSSGRETIAPEDVRSFAAVQDPGSTNVTSAADTGLVPPALQRLVFIPQGTGMVLSVLTETPLALARLINSQAHRPFSALVPMQWLWTQKLSAEARAAVRDFVSNCYLPAKIRLFEETSPGVPLTFQALLPWGGTPLVGVLAQIQVTPGGQGGLPALVRRALGRVGILEQISCDAYAALVEQNVITWLNAQQTARGTPLATVFAQELQMPPETAARFLIYREMLRAAGPEIPAPSLTGTYLLLRATGLLGQIGIGSAAGAAEGGLRGLETVGPAGAKAGALFGAIEGAASGLGRGLSNELQQIIDGVSGLLRPALFLIWWGPYVFGIINLVLLMLFPMVLLWTLTPGQQFRPLITYFTLLFVTTSTPLWWALVDIAARLAGNLGDSFFVSPGQWLHDVAAQLVVTVVGMVAVLVAIAVMVMWTGISAAMSLFRAGGV